MASDLLMEEYLVVNRRVWKLLGSMLDNYCPQGETGDCGQLVQDGEEE